MEGDAALGLVNLVVVAAWVTYGPRVPSVMEIPAVVWTSVCGWVVLGVSWLVITLAMPSITDNRPRREPMVSSGDVGE